MNLYPYNYYVLYISIAAVLAMLFYTLKTALDMKKSLDTKKPLLDHMQAQLELANVKVSAVQEKKAEDRKKNRAMKIALPILLAVYNNYRRNAEANGVNGIYTSAKKVATDEKQRTQVIARIRKSL